MTRNNTIDVLYKWGGGGKEHFYGMFEPLSIYYSSWHCPNLYDPHYSYKETEH